MCHSQVSFPFHVTRKVLCASSRAPHKTTPARACARGPRAPLAAVARPRRRRAAPDLRRAFDLATAAVGVGPASRPSGAPEPRRPSAVIGTRGRGRLPASTAPPARSVPLGTPTRRPADGEPLRIETRSDVADRSHCAQRRFLRRRGRSRCTFFSQALAQYPVSTPTESRRPRGRQGRARGQWTYRYIMYQYYLGGLIDPLD